MPELPKSWSLEAQREYVVGVVAGLKAIDRAAPLVGPWEAAKRERRDAMGRRDDARDKAVETSARVALYDTEWDEAVRQLSSGAYEVAGKDAGAPPYAELFGSVKAVELTRLGPARATTAGANLVKLARATGNAKLVPLAAALETKTQALETAWKADVTAEGEALVQEVERTRLLRQLQQLVAETEADVLKLFPGRKDLVRALLGWDTGGRGAEKDEKKEE